MTLADDVKTVLTNNAPLMAILTGGVYAGVEEISRQNTPGAFDHNKEIRPCALIKLGTEVPFRAAGITNAVQSPVTVYFYQRLGYAEIAEAEEIVFDLLNDAKISDGMWRMEFDIVNFNLRDTALDCAMISIRLTAKRLR